MAAANYITLGFKIIQKFMSGRESGGVGEKIDRLDSKVDELMEKVDADDRKELLEKLAKVISELEARNDRTDSRVVASTSSQEDSSVPVEYQIFMYKMMIEKLEGIALVSTRGHDVGASSFSALAVPHVVNAWNTPAVSYPPLMSLHPQPPHPYTTPNAPFQQMQQLHHMVVGQRPDNLMFNRQQSFDYQHQHNQRQMMRNHSDLGRHEVQNVGAPMVPPVPRPGNVSSTPLSSQQHRPQRYNNPRPPYNNAFQPRGDQSQRYRGQRPNERGNYRGSPGCRQGYQHRTRSLSSHNRRREGSTDNEVDSLDIKFEKNWFNSDSPNSDKREERKNNDRRPSTEDNNQNKGLSHQQRFVRPQWRGKSPQPNQRKFEAKGVSPNSGKTGEKMYSKNSHQNKGKKFDTNKRESSAAINKDLMKYLRTDPLPSRGQLLCEGVDLNQELKDIFIRSGNNYSRAEHLSDVVEAKEKNANAKILDSEGYEIV